MVTYILFTLACNVVLLNLLIALMGSVFDKVADVASAQYRLDKTKLMISLERLFLYRESQLKSKRWLHVIAPENGMFWTGVVLNDMTAIRQLSSNTDSMVDKMRFDVDALKSKSDDLRKQIDTLSLDMVKQNQKRDADRTDDKKQFTESQKQFAEIIK